MKGIIRIVVLMCSLALGLGPVVETAGGAQAQQSQQPPAKQPATGAAPAQPAPPPVNKEEEDAYVAFVNARRETSEKQAQMGEEFLQKFADSRYRESIYSRLAAVYQNLGQDQKMFAAGDKALELNPDNVDVLTLVGWMLPRKASANDLDFDQKLQRAEKLSKHAMTLIAAMTKPGNLTEEDFAKAKSERISMAHSGLGMVYYRRQRPVEMVASYEQATQLSTSPDPSDLFMLGEGYALVKRYGDAGTTFDRCGQIGWAWQERCKRRAEEVKKLSAAPPAPAAPAPKP